MIKNNVISDNYLFKYGIGEITQSELLNLFLNTAKIIAQDNDKYRFLVYPDRPREHELKKIIIDSLTEKKYYHMIERPINIPAISAKNGNTGFVDISIYTNSGMVDIELKESPSKRENNDKLDMPKILSSESKGCSVFYFFRGGKINRQTDLILTRYQKAYDNQYKEYKNRNLLTDKWLLFFLFAYRENRAYSFLYENIYEVNFDFVKNNENKYL